MGLGDRESDSPVAEVDPRAGTDRLSGRRQGLIKKGVPEEKLEEDRDVLHHLDVNGCQPGHEPVGGKARYPDDGAQDKGDDDADEGHLQRVQSSHQQSAAVSIRGGIGDEGFTDFKGGFFLKERKAGGDVLPLQVRDGIRKEIIAQESYQAERGDLIKNGPLLGVIPEGYGLPNCLGSFAFHQPT